MTTTAAEALAPPVSEDPKAVAAELQRIIGSQTQRFLGAVEEAAAGRASMPTAWEISAIIRRLVDNARKLGQAEARRAPGVQGSLLTLDLASDRAAQHAAFHYLDRLGNNGRQRTPQPWPAERIAIHDQISEAAYAGFTEHLLVASDGARSEVLERDTSPLMEYEVEHMGLDYLVDSIVGHPHEQALGPGLWVWEGRIETTKHYDPWSGGTEYDTHGEGSYRSLSRADFLLYEFGLFYPASRTASYASLVCTNLRARLLEIEIEDFDVEQCYQAAVRQIEAAQADATTSPSPATP